MPPRRGPRRCSNLVKNMLTQNLSSSLQAQICKLFCVSSLQLGKNFKWCTKTQKDPWQPKTEIQSHHAQRLMRQHLITRPWLCSIPQRSFSCGKRNAPLDSADGGHPIDHLLGLKKPSRTVTIKLNGWCTDYRIWSVISSSSNLNR